MEATNKSQTAAIRPTNSRRIVSNALVLFVRMFVLTIISLYAVRIVLKGLGEVDYGIYTTVVGVVTTSTFISSVLALSVQRFYSFSMGKNELEKLSDVFSASSNISFVLSLTVLIIFESLGFWFVSHCLTIPAGRMTATLLAFQFALFSFIFSLLQIPYTAALFAHEDMGVYALISTIECFLKLGAAFLMSKSSLDHLVFYAALLLIISFIVMSCYVIIAKRSYAECKYHKVKTKRLHRELLSFSSWTFLGTTANVGIIQGNTILLNIFYGPLMNAAFGIALQINTAFASLNNCIILALRPAMIKSYADNNTTYLNKLFYIGNKMILYVLIGIGIPFVYEMDTILHLWLGSQVSEATILFSRLIIIYMIVMAMNMPITTIVQATGKLKEYHLPVESITLLSIPVTMILFLLKLPAWSVFASMIGIALISHAVRLFCLRRCYGDFSIRQYITSLCIPATLICLLASCLGYFLHYCLISDTIIRLLSFFAAFPLLVVVLVYAVGISSDERTIFCQYVSSKLKRSQCNR